MILQIEYNYISCAVKHIFQFEQFVLQQEAQLDSNQAMQQKVFNSSQMPTCQVCSKQALFQCSSCEKVFYCSRDHQFQHWKKQHKADCQVKNQPSDDSLKKILQVRKRYYENFSHKQFTQCLLDAKVLVGFERKRLQIDASAANQLDYGGTVCLLTKTYLLLNDKKSAKQQLQNYLKQKMDLIQDLTDIPNDSQKQAIRQKYYEHLQKKLNLISCIGNLCYAIGIDCISYYVLYTKIVMIFFKPDSYEASNCYFLIGCYYAQQGYFKKAIQCFKKSANIRGQYAGDCYYNIGILYKLQGQLLLALQILQKAYKLRLQQYGNDSNKVAEVYEMKGIIYTQLNDFKTGMAQFQKAFKMRASQPISSELLNVLQLIHQLYDKLTVFIQQGQPQVKKPDIYIHLKASIQNDKNYWQEPKYKKKINENVQEKDNKKVQVAIKKQQDKNKAKQQKFEYNLQLTQQFTSHLNLAQLFRLSQLQLQLQKCTTQFGIIYTIGTSAFYLNLSPQNYLELQKDNQKLFQMIKLQQLKKMKNSQS